MKKTVFKGIATALITPMNADGSVNFGEYRRLIDWQIDQKIDALVSCGTTGEASTLSVEEHLEVVARAVEYAGGRVPVIAGTGSNDTAQALELTHGACKAGADAMLVCTPYYNKATQKGLVKMFSTIADASDKPVILYNVPSRTGVGIDPATCEALAAHGNIAAIKEAGGDISKTLEISARTEGRLDIYSGNDDQIVPVMSLGGIGCISVLSNVVPAGTREICTRWFAGDTAGAAALQRQYLPLISALFCEVNPIPVKAAMAAMGYGADALRSPLTPMEPDHRERLFAAMRGLGISV